MKIKIEKEVPLPANSGRGRGRLYPFHDMEVGDSFLVKDKKIAVVCRSIMYFRRKHPEMQFTSRTIGNDVRVWRFA